MEGPVTWKLEEYGPRSYSDGVVNEWFNNETHTPPTIVPPFRTDEINWTSGNYPPETGWSGNHNNFSVRYTGKFYADHDGNYSFQEHADDQTWLLIDGTQVLTNNQWNVDVSVTIPLTKGWHDIEYRTREGGGGDDARLSWDPDGGTDWELMTVENAYLSDHTESSIGWALLATGDDNVGGPLPDFGDFGVQLGLGPHDLRLTVEWEDGSVTVLEKTVYVPEPVTLSLCGLAGCGLAGYVRRRRT